MVNLKSIMKQEGECSCLAAAVQTILNSYGITDSQKEIYEQIKIPDEIAPTGFSLMETAGRYLAGKLPKGCIVEVYRGEIIPEKAEDFVGLTYLRRQNRLEDFNMDAKGFCEHKDNEMRKAEEAGVRICRGATPWLFAHLDDFDSVIIGINVEPIGKYLAPDANIDFDYGHAVLPKEADFSEQRITFGDPAPEVPEFLEVPLDVMINAMSKMGQNLKDGFTEAIVVKKR